MDFSDRMKRAAEAEKCASEAKVSKDSSLYADINQGAQGGTGVYQAGPLRRADETLPGCDSPSPTNNSIQNMMMQRAEAMMKSSFALHDQGTAMREMANGLESLAGCLPSNMPEPAYRVLKLMLRTMHF